MFLSSRAAAPGPLGLPAEPPAQPQALPQLCLLSRPRVSSFSAWAPPHPRPPHPPSPSQSLAPSALYAPALPGLPGSGCLPTSPRAAPRAPSQACAPVLPRSSVPPLPAFRSLQRWRLLPRPPQLAMPSALGQQWDLVGLPVFCCDTNPAGAVIAQHLAVTTHTCSVAKTCQCRAGPPGPGPCSLQQPVCWGVDGVPRVSCARSRAA